MKQDVEQHEVMIIDFFDQKISVGDTVVFSYTNIDRSLLCAHPTELVTGLVMELYADGRTIKVRSTKPKPGLKKTTYEMCALLGKDCVKLHFDGG